MSTQALALAIRALSPEGITRYDGQPPTGATMPWLVMNQSVPEIVTRSEADTPQGHRGSVLLTIAGGNEDAVLGRLDLVLPAFEGARVSAEGWLTSPLRRIGDVKVFPDPSVTLTSGLHPIVGKATFEYTVTALVAA